MDRDSLEEGWKIVASSSLKDSAHSGQDANTVTQSPGISQKTSDCDPPQDGCLILAAWEEELPLDDPQREFLIKGIKEGFGVTNKTYEGSPIQMDNYKSATLGKAREMVEAQIKEEIDNGRYEVVSAKPVIISAMGSLPKRGSDKVRLIHDCSRPSGAAVNDLAEHSPFTYQSLQDAVDLITPGCFLGKIDCQSAYRSVKTHPNDHVVTGLAWTFKGDRSHTYLVDKRLPFGSRLAPGIFNELSQAVRRIMYARGYKGIVAYLDDFFCCGRTRTECQDAMDALRVLLRKLGFAINYSKIEGPTTRLTFLGITLDTLSMTTQIPEDKMGELRQELLVWMGKNRVTKRQMQSLAGKLNWATQCVYGGRYHLRRLLDAMNSLKKPWHNLKMNRDMKADIEWWLEYMCDFNGVNDMVSCRPATPISIDASQLAAGGVHGSAFFSLPWSQWEGTSDKHINFKEVLALEPAVFLWAEHWRNKKVFVHSDNRAAVGIINKGSCRDTTVMASLRRVFWASAVYNFRLKAVYYPGERNVLADAASRLHQPGMFDFLFGKTCRFYL